MDLPVITFVVDCSDKEQAAKTVRSVVHIANAQKQLILVGPYASAVAAQSPASTACETIDAQGGCAESFNCGLAKAGGDFVVFADAGTIYPAMDFQSVLKQMQTAPAAALCGAYSIGDQKKRYAAQPKVSGLYAPEVSPCAVHLLLDCFFFTTSAVSHLRFDPQLQDECKIKFLMDFYRESGTYAYLDAFCVTAGTYGEDVPDWNHWQQCEWWYTSSIQRFLLPLLQAFSGRAPLYVQQVCMYLLGQKFNCNLEERNKYILREEQLDDFYAAVKQMLQSIDDAVIFAAADTIGVRLPRILRWQLLQLKKEKAATVQSDAVFFGDSLKIADLKDEFVSIRLMNLKENLLEICGELTAGDYLSPEDIRLFVVKNKKERVPVVHSSCYPLVKCFGETISHRYLFSVQIPVKAGDRLSFLAVLQAVQIPFSFQFSKEAGSRIASTHANGYWCMNKDLLMRHQNNQTLLIEKNTFWRRVKRELCFDVSALRTEGFSYGLKIILFRWLYFVVRPFYKHKRVWLYFDKLYKGGDNAEYLFQYAVRQNDGIRHYYVVNADSPDYLRLKAQRLPLLKFESYKHKLYALLAENIMATHSSTMGFAGYTKRLRVYFKDLYDANIICVQHGLTIQQIAQYQNRWFDNTKLYCCASYYEIENLKKPIYDYPDSALQLTGLARYDGLKNNDQKIILITPTWRRNLTNVSDGFGKKRTYNEEFKHSEYFRLYNRLINDTAFLQCAKQNGYSVLFLLHPLTSPQIDDFEKNEQVQILAAADDVSYETILTQSSLMVTDYSGVQFDFAYQSKPVVYYHPETLPPQYEEGGLIYDTMGFGPVCTEHAQLVETLCEYMQNGCRMPKIYQKRRDDFFAFSDFNNCKRIYEAIIQFSTRENGG